MPNHVTQGVSCAAQSAKKDLPETVIASSVTPAPDVHEKKIPFGLKHFDSLPDAAFVRQPVVEALYGCSAATVWRGVKAGRIPTPTRLSPRTVGWNVGQLRQALGDA